MLFTHECKIINNGKEIIRNFAKDPAVIFFKDCYFLYFSTLFEEDNKFRIGIAKSKDLETWEYVGLLPLVGDVEAKGIAAPAAFERDGELHLFYQTYGNLEKDAICHAVSPDGVRFERDTTNPVFAPSTSWCCGRAIDADVVRFKDKLLMYFATRDKEFKIQKLGVCAADINSDFSKNEWKELNGESILFPELEWEKNCIEAPATIEEDGCIYLFYGGGYNCEPQQIGLAVSKDGVHFVRTSEHPYMTNGKKGTWNSCESGHPYVYRTPVGEILLFFQGSPDNGVSWYISKVTISNDMFHFHFD